MAKKENVVKELSEQEQERLDRNKTLRRKPFNCVTMTKEIRSLASGTVARLCGSAKYEVIDAHTAEWVQWVLTQDFRRQWSNWQECHEDYLAHLRGEHASSEKEGHGRQSEFQGGVLLTEWGDE
jgi:hypothetical protein